VKTYPIGPITAPFVVLFVKQGRKRLARHLAQAKKTFPNGRRFVPKAAQIPVKLEGFIYDARSVDDGEIQEFCLRVTRVSMREVKPIAMKVEKIAFD
jgi:hypothetical protein